MIRRIIKINEDLCNGCGACAAACHESAIAMVNGKAKLIKDDYCDGLGDCLPACPAGAISFEEREAAAYDEAAVKARIAAAEATAAEATAAKATAHVPGSCLSQWPVQIKLTPTQAPCFQDARLLIAADCTAFAYGNFHQEFIAERITLIGCPKLDMTDYSEKLTEIIRANDIRDITVVRMEVPCCGGIELAVKNALKASQKALPCQVVTVKIDGSLA